MARGLIGKTANADILSNKRYAVYVGGQTQQINATTATNTTITFALTGGIDTVPREGDLVLINFTVAGTSDVDMSNKIVTSGYGTPTELYYNATTTDTNMGVAGKVMGSTPDTQVVVGPTTSTNFGGCVAIHVWRGIDVGSPYDATTTTASGTDLNANPPSITPGGPGVIVYTGSVCHQRGAQYMRPPEQGENFVTDTKDAGNDASAGFASNWNPSGAAFDPVTFTHSGTASTTYSWGAATMALNPQTLNKKNSGVWGPELAYNTGLKTKSLDISRTDLILDLDAGDPKSYPRTGSTWYDLSGTGNNATIYGGMTWHPDGYFMFDGSSGYALASLATTASVISICVWAFVPSNAMLGGLAHNGNGDTNGYGFGVGTTTYDAAPGGNNFIALHPAVVWVDTNVNMGTGWHCLTLAKTSATNIRFLLDNNTANVYNNAAVTANVAPTAGNFQIGAQYYSGTTRFWPGHIARVMVYSSVISTTTNTKNYDAMMRRFGNG